MDEVNEVDERPATGAHGGRRSQRRDDGAPRAGGRGGGRHLDRRRARARGLLPLPRARRAGPGPAVLVRGDLAPRHPRRAPRRGHPGPVQGGGRSAARSAGTGGVRAPGRRRRRRLAVPDAAHGDVPHRPGARPAAVDRHRRPGAGRRRAAHDRGGADARGRPVAAVDRRRAGRPRSRPWRRRGLPPDGDRRRPDGRGGAGRGALPRPDGGPRIQRVDLHRPHGDVDGGRRRCRAGGRARRPLGTAARRRAEPRARHAQGDRLPGERPRLGAGRVWRPGTGSWASGTGCTAPRTPARRS